MGWALLRIWIDLLWAVHRFLSQQDNLVDLSSLREIRGDFKFRRAAAFLLSYREIALWAAISGLGLNLVVKQPKYFLQHF